MQICADEMGLGKTIQALAFISCVRYENLSSRPALVIVPKSTLPGWELVSHLTQSFQETFKVSMGQFKKIVS